MRVGLISDTHGLVRPEALAALQGSERILHAGDIGKPQVLDALGELAPVTAIRGNVDRCAWAAALPADTVVELAGVRVLLVHDVKELGGEPATHQVDAVVAGHSHVPGIGVGAPPRGRPQPGARQSRPARGASVLYVNPGSAGPRRFRLPVTVGRLDIEGERIEARVIELEVPPPRPPTVAGRRRSRR